MKSLKFIILILIVFAAFVVYGQKSEGKVSFRDSTDNAIDVSDWLLNKKGFLVVPSLITEPAVGYGAAAAG